MNLVLAHGFLGFQHRFGMRYFHGVAEFLRHEFAHQEPRILEAEVAPLARIGLRARQLRDQILTALADGRLDPREKVHIIAHSMGGLDARWCVSPGNAENIGQRVASLSTIATPHRGSPVADLLVARPLASGRSLGPQHRYNALVPYLESVLGIVDLTSEGLRRFNARCPDHPQVRYFAYAGRGRQGSRPTCRLLRPCYWLVARREGPENDGLVSVASARWGEFPEPPWPADHADEIGHDLDHGRTAKPAFDYLARYRAIVERLAAIPLRTPPDPTDGQRPI